MYQNPPEASPPMRYLGLAYAQRMTQSPRWQRYSLALVFFLVALAARFELVDVLPEKGFPFLTFFPAVLLATYLTGLGPGLLASGLSFLAAWFFFIQPDRSVALSGADLVALSFFSAILLIDCLVIHFMKSALTRVNRTERQLRESSQRLRLVLDNLYVYVSILSLDGNVQEVNEEALLAAEIRRDEILGLPLWKAAWWAGDVKQQQHVRAAIERATTGETARFDIEVSRAGKTFTIDFQVGPLREGSGQITALVASGVDVTDRVVALAALHVSRKEAVSAAEAAEAERRLLNATFNAVPASIMVADAQGRILRMNESTEDIWGMVPIAENVASYGEWKGWWADGSARHGQRILAHEWGMARSLQGETCNDIIEIEPFGRPNERLFTMLSSAPVLGAAGEVVGGVVAQLDITDRIHAEKALRERQQLLQSTMDNFPTAIAYKDIDGRFLDVNHKVEKVLGMSRQAICGLTMHDLMPAATADVLRQNDLEVMQSRLAIRTEKSTPLDGGTLHHLDTSFPLINTEGCVYGTGHITHDITDIRIAENALNAANEQLREADRQKDEFLATLAHELRNPLAPIRTAVEVIRLRNPADQAVQRARFVIERQVLHLTRLVDDLLDIARITQGTVHLQQETLDLCAVVQSAIDSVQSTLDAAGLTLTHLTGQPPIPVRGDATRLVQCVINLLTNAIKFTPSGGGISVRVTQEGRTVAIEVSDNGSGIPASSLERIFELFVQERPSGLHGNTGLGIGLALTRKLVLLHGGSVQAASAGPGQGSTFRIELPADGAPDSVPAPAAEAPATDGGGARLLVVEDNRDAADLLAEMMEMTGFRVSVAYTGESALAAMEKDMPDAVLMDIGLPDVNGYEVCRRLRQLPVARQPVAIALTGWGNDNDRDRATEAGFNGHLTKPAEPDRIIALLHELLAAAGGPAAP
ncbi:PAS domain-containing protein [Polaromonas sp.]|uniref:PAS domain-containing protein n=1 Tax=Polaromonas sp. TaxID=1869339 RepID=UPI0013B615DA|nr:PAS domain-containing protein [Polaromonas sp.]NDP61550.1 PAS domain-containing protein [Polaromonas sp.]